MTTAIICGGRSYGIVPRGCEPEDYTRFQQEALRERARLAQILREAGPRLGVTRMVMGDQTGADYLAASWCQGNGMAHQVYPAPWREMGNGAGPYRNRQMVTQEDPRPTLCIAFPGTKGTRNMCSIAGEYGIRIIKVDWT